jgi:hypothetical protein
MKTKIKNEFQNPDLIFGNENQKRKLKLKNKILKSIIYSTFFLFLLSACMLDSDSYMPYIISVACMMILIVFMIANWGTISKYDIRR